MKNSFKILPLITASIFCLNTPSSLSMNTDPTIEGAAHFSAGETKIFQSKIPKVKNLVFNEFYTQTKVNETGNYVNAIRCFADRRAKIAELCVEAGFLDKKEGKLFYDYRLEGDPRGINNYITPLTPGDNEFFYSKALKMFEQGPQQIESSLGTFSSIIKNITSNQFETHLERVQKIYKKNTNDNELSDQDVSIMKHPFSSEVYCLSTLLGTEESVKFFNKNKELGQIIEYDSNMHALLSPETGFSILRFTLAMKDETINLGSISCLSIQTSESTYKYYPLFAIDHCRANNIERLLSLAEKYWEKAINWCKVDEPTDFFNNLAKVFYLQTIAAPHIRGSESNAKAQIECIARYHDEELVFSPKLAFRMPFILSPDEFIKHFSSNVYFKSTLENMID